MKLTHIVISGADNQTPPDWIIDLSMDHPWLEWGILLSETSINRARYPGQSWIANLIETRQVRSEELNTRIAFHLCGQTMRHFISKKFIEAFGPWFGELSINSLSNILFNEINRMQINFSMDRHDITLNQVSDSIEMFIEDTDSDNAMEIITQHNSANAEVWDHIRQATRGSAMKYHHLLNDCSGGQGISPDEPWPLPVAGMLTGYAGGISPDNVEEVLCDLEEMIPEGYTWIDMESGVRGDNGNLSLDKVEEVVGKVQRLGDARGWFSPKLYPTLIP